MIWLLVTPLALAGASAELTDAERRALDQGALIIKERAVENYPWPEVTVYRRIAVSPAEVMAVYADFDGQARYLPNLVRSRVVEQLSRHSFHVSYEYEVVGPNERYTVLATVSRLPGGFQVTWQLITARYMRQLSGQMQVEGDGTAALLTYTNRVDPGFWGVRLGSPVTTARQLQATVQALTSQAERLRAEEQEKLQALVQTLRSMLEQP